MSREVGVLQVDAFTGRAFTGNPAGVVLDAEGLDETAMLRIAREMSVSETAFLLPPTGASADLRLRWFSPQCEVDLCGHATVAAFHAALEPASCGLDAALGLDEAALVRIPPPMRTGEWALVPVTGLEPVRRLRPDGNALRAVARATGLRSVVALTTETVETASLVHLRMFAPDWGIDEDPVTGSAQGPVAAWLAAYGLLQEAPGDSTEATLARYTAEQGDTIGRPGRVAVEVRLDGRRVVSITITGEAVTVMRGVFILPG